MATIILEFADQGWHVRWNTPDTEEFIAIKEAFKAALPLRERYWDQEAFGKKGGWWVSYGALSLVGHLFENYQTARETLEQPYWATFEQQQEEARKRFIIEEMTRRQQEQKEAHQQRRRQEQREKRQQKKAAEQERQREASQERQRAEQHRQTRSREEVKLPKTFEEALAILHLTAPVTASDVKKAYRTQAFKAHPDRGGSHAAMIRVNAAYEMALAAC
jgi:flagellar biosynthesis GTPase FlhF